MTKDENAGNRASLGDFEIIENTVEARETYSSAHGSEYDSGEFRITESMILALRSGKCIAINDGEGSTFITMDTSPFSSLDP